MDDDGNLKLFFRFVVIISSGTEWNVEEKVSINLMYQQ